MKRSVRRRGQRLVGSRPVVSQTVTLTISGEGEKVRAGRPRWAAVMKACQIGPAPVMPETASMGVLSALPTQTPAARSGV